MYILALASSYTIICLIRELGQRCWYYLYQALDQINILERLFNERYIAQVGMVFEANLLVL